MTRILMSSDVLTCLHKLNDATKWLAIVRADVGAGQERRIEWISEDIAYVRDELLRASVGDVEVEARAADCPACGLPLIDGHCTPECDAIRAEDEREERAANGWNGVGA